MLAQALKKASSLSTLGGNHQMMGFYKQELKGFVAEEILAYCFPEGKAHSSRGIPAGLHSHIERVVVHAAANPMTWGARYKELEEAKEKLRMGAKL